MPLIPELPPRPRRDDPLNQAGDALIARETERVLRRLEAAGVPVRSSPAPSTPPAREYPGPFDPAEARRRRADAARGR